MESKVMAKKNEMTHDDLMQLPNDIAGMVLEVQGRQTQPATLHLNLLQSRQLCPKKGT